MRGIAADASSDNGTASAQFVSELIAETPIARLQRWQCVPESAGGWTLERTQSWPMVSFCHRGAFLATSDGWARSLVDRNTAWVVFGGKPYSTRRVAPAAGLDIAVRPDVLDEALWRKPPERLEQNHTIEIDSSLRLHESRVFSSATGSLPSSGLSLEEEVLLLAGKLAAGKELWKLARPVPPARAASYVNRAKAFLAVSYRERIGIVDIARAAGASPFHLARLFRSVTGLSLHQYLVRLRLYAAVDRVHDPVVDLGSLALELGFSHHSHFTRAFRRQFGVSPGSLRRSGRACRRSARDAARVAGRARG